jgi:hypothetical protein
MNDHKHNEILERIYYKTFDNINELYNKIKSIDDTVEFGYVKKWLHSQPVYQISKQNNKIKKIENNNTYIISNQQNNFQVDLMYLSQYKSFNDNFHIIMVCIDISSRYLFTYMMQNKNTDTILKAFRKFRDDVKNISNVALSNINIDEESAFLSNEFKSFLKRNNITSYISNSKLHKIPIADRVIRTLRTKLNKFFIVNNSFKWYSKKDSNNLISIITDNYNSSIHRTTSSRPDNLFHNVFDQNDFREKQIILNHIADNNVIKYKIGDIVRVQIKNKLFRKNIGVNFTSRLFIIIKMNKSYVKLEDIDNGDVYENMKYKYLIKIENINFDKHERDIEEKFAENEKKNSISNKLKKELNNLK